MYRKVRKLFSWTDRNDKCSSSRIVGYKVKATTHRNRRYAWSALKADINQTIRNESLTGEVRL